jgi:hypothetical protein
MIHAGVGSPAVGRDTLQRGHDHPGARLILAHCAKGFFDWIIHEVPEVGNVFFDTPGGSPAHIWALFGVVSPDRILYASDIPFGQPRGSTGDEGRLAIEAGLTAEQTRGVMGGQLERLPPRRAVGPGSSPPSRGTTCTSMRTPARHPPHRGSGPTPCEPNSRIRPSPDGRCCRTHP